MTGARASIGRAIVVTSVVLHVYLIGNAGGAATLLKREVISAVPSQTASIALPHTAQLVNWQQFHFNPAHTGSNPYEVILSRDTVSQLALGWRHLMLGTSTTSPVIDRGVAFVGATGGSGHAWVYAIDANTGSTKWVRDTYGGALLGVAASHGVVYATTLTGYVLALRETTGRVLWQFSGGAMGIPTLAGGMLFLLSNDAHLYALDAATGARIWSVATGAAGTTAPALANGVLYLSGTYAQEVIAYDAATGHRLWSFPTTDYVFGSPAVAGGVVFVGSADDYVYALDGATGSLLWKTATGGAVESSPAVAGGIVYIGSDDHRLYALDAVTGSIVWSFETGDALQGASPVLANGVVYVASLDHFLYALAQDDGAMLWSYETGGGINTAPAVVNGVVYAGSADRFFYSFGLPA